MGEPVAEFALTVWQPYAGALCWGVKPGENRTKAPGLPPGSRILIHAGLRYDRESWERGMATLASVDHVERFARPPWPLSPEPPNHDADPDGSTPYGAIIGEVTLEEVRRAARPGDPWFVGPVCWYFRRPVAIQPVFCAGQQWLWRPKPDVLSAARARVAAEVARRRAELTASAASLRCPRCKSPVHADEELQLICKVDPSHGRGVRPAYATKHAAQRGE